MSSSFFKLIASVFRQAAAASASVDNEGEDTPKLTPPKADTSEKFLPLISRVLGHEGRYVNNPADPGGETNWGISKRSYPNVDIKNLTEDKATTIYYEDFWLPLHADNFSDGAGYQLLDSAVNSGISQSLRFAQRALGVADDGQPGPQTLAAINKASETDFIMLFNAERLDFMRKLKHWDEFGRGWAGRIAQNLRYGATDS